MTLELNESISMQPGISTLSNNKWTAGILNITKLQYRTHISESKNATNYAEKNN